MVPKADVGFSGTCVPDKPAEALDTMSRYSAQILICFIAYTLWH